MEMSPEINELAKALAVAQGNMEGAKKDSDNPFFKSKYADLQSVWAACRAPLTANGLSIVQSPRTETTEHGVRVCVDTLLMHASGQWVRNSVSVAPKDDSPQAVGSCISYLRRYSLAAFAGVAPEDDDAEAAEGRREGQPNVAMRVDGPKPDRRGPLTITSVVKKETKRKNFFRWEVILSDGRKAAFVNNDRMAALCEALAQSGAEVDVVIERGEYGPELTEVVPVKQVEQPAQVSAVAGQEQPF